MRGFTLILAGYTAVRHPPLRDEEGLHCCFARQGSLCTGLEELGLVVRKIRISIKKLDLEIAVQEANLSYLNPLHSKVRVEI